MVLTKAMKKYILSKQKNGYPQSQYNSRLREYVRQALIDLAILADNLPEEQQTQIFNATTMAPLFQSLFTFSNPKTPNQPDQPQSSQSPTKQMDEEKFEKRRSRIMKLCCEAMDDIGEITNAHNLAPYETSILQLSGHGDALPALTGTQAIYLKGFGLRQKQPP